MSGINTTEIKVANRNVKTSLLILLLVSSGFTHLNANRRIKLPL